MSEQVTRETVTEALEYYWRIAVQQSEFELKGRHGIERIFKASSLSLQEQQNPSKIPMLGKGDTIGMIKNEDLRAPKCVDHVTLLYLFEEKRLPLYQRMILLMDSGTGYGKERVDIIFLGRYVDPSRRAEIPATQHENYENPNRDYLHFSVVCGAPQRKPHLVLARTMYSLYHFALDHLEDSLRSSLSGWSEEQVLKNTYPLQAMLCQGGVTIEPSEHSLYNHMEYAIGANR